ncbi:16S rRNA (uracil(1498)-N(3))-methyltransferase [Cohnella cholangitidis]|uniref:Ribosomal RNA small subunit methyltransferase E n=1 Tax=Cohnella cholangitidis TaxID=2598458 RepID=A0A7G5BU11_9BACL|nr:16S rRNA (uracil(1498)-N(3))-methyltransferase [Cohnella cholangitidis]QMV40445.1 16S rRNA (uracil(1498)-N(3))-methyltransferase [Cohnella cholangitidis]
MQRYFVPAALMGERSVALEGEDARHVAAVMRSKPGDCFIACDGNGRDVLAKIVSVDKDKVQADIVEELSSNAEMAWKVTVAQSLPKGDKLEIVIQKGTEAGAFAFQPFLSQRTVVQYDERKEAKRIERWRKIAKEAAEQSHRSIVPQIDAVSSWKALLKRFAEYDLVLFCYEEEGRSGNGLRELLANFKSELSPTSATAPRVMVVIGPEGGFTPQEAEAATASGAKWVGLGKRILRTETAALFALACLAYESGELGGI